MAALEDLPIEIVLEIVKFVSKLIHLLVQV